MTSVSQKRAGFGLHRIHFNKGLSLLLCHYFWLLFAVNFVDVILIDGIFFSFCVHRPTSLSFIKEASAPATIVNYSFFFFFFYYSTKTI